MAEELGYQRRYSDNRAVWYEDDNRKVLGWCLLKTNSLGPTHIMFYVRANMRGKGIAKKLYTEARKHTSSEMYGKHWNQDSKDFFKSMGIDSIYAY